VLGAVLQVRGTQPMITTRRDGSHTAVAHPVAGQRSQRYGQGIEPGSPRVRGTPLGHDNNVVRFVAGCGVQVAATARSQRSGQRSRQPAAGTPNQVYCRNADGSGRTDHGRSMSGIDTTTKLTVESRLRDASRDPTTGRENVDVPGRRGVLIGVTSSGRSSGSADRNRLPLHRITRSECHGHERQVHC
jgi:hypothetical protein